MDGPSKRLKRQRLPVAALRAQSTAQKKRPTRIVPDGPFALAVRRSLLLAGGNRDADRFAGPSGEAGEHRLD